MNTRTTLFALASLLAIVSQAQDNSWAVTISTTNTMVAPDLAHTTTNIWATGDFDAQSYIINSNGVAYWTPNGGSSTGQPVHATGIVADPDAQWLAMRSVRRAPRGVLQVQSLSTNDVWIRRGGAASTNASTLLNARGAWREFADYQGAVYAVVTTNTESVVVTEW